MTDLNVGVSSGSRAQFLSGSTQSRMIQSRASSKQLKWISDDDVVIDGGEAPSVQIKRRRPWRQSNHGTARRRSCRKMGQWTQEYID